MRQLQFFSIPSPCIGVCQSGPRGYCRGCLRSREERFAWQQMTEEEKARVIRLCKQRKRRLLARQRQLLQQQRFEELKQYQRDWLEDAMQSDEKSTKQTATDENLLAKKER